jgi:hypothetical protein
LTQLCTHKWFSEKIQHKNNGSREQTKQRGKKSRYIKGNVTMKGRVSKAFHAIILENNEQWEKQ